jgi:hypothetical protein
MAETATAPRGSIGGRIAARVDRLPLTRVQWQLAIRGDATKKPSGGWPTRNKVSSMPAGLHCRSLITALPMAWVARSSAAI